MATEAQDFIMSNWNFQKT